ncbi:MAG: succinate dehydrogenase [Gammaproteobacteria bacterium]|nr:succinate dehydrogenase [Gammaproteobacteria bacterium]
MERYLFLAQRLTAMVLGPLVLIHLGLILYAVEGGLTASEILSRTRGSVGWGAFYGLFVIMAAIHGPIGLRNVLNEWTSLPKTATLIITLGLGLLLLILGARSVVAVVGLGG